MPLMVCSYTAAIYAMARLFHGFGQAKFAYGGLVLGLSQFSILPQLPLMPSMNDAQLKSGQN